jgi:hypothetical protein
MPRHFVIFNRIEIVLRRVSYFLLCTLWGPRRQEIKVADFTFLFPSSLWVRISPGTLDAVIYRGYPAISRNVSGSTWFPQVNKMSDGSSKHVTSWQWQCQWDLKHQTKQTLTYGFGIRYLTAQYCIISNFI